MSKIGQENDYGVKLQKLILLEEIELKRIFISVIDSEISYLKIEIDNLDKQIFKKNNTEYKEIKRKLKFNLANKMKEYEQYRKEINKLIELIADKQKH